MYANPILKKLGFAETDRVVIIHADDVGMCHATLPAFAELIDVGVLSCGSVMVPCPWFSQVAAYCRSHPTVDMGVHLTLTNEWHGYRWGPISTCDPVSGLIDNAGYFHHRSPQVQKHGEAGAVQREIQAQIKRALAAGIDVTHIDSHMFTIFHPRFASFYVQLALQHQIPALLLRTDESGLRALGFDAETATFFAQQIEELEAQGVFMLDHLYIMPLDQSDNRLEQAKQVLDTLPPGITHLIIHPAQDTPELRAIAPDWPARVADYQTFTCKELRDYVKKAGVQIIGYSTLRTLMRSG